MITTLSPQQLRHAASLIEKIQKLKKKLNRLVGVTAYPKAFPAKKKKFKLGRPAYAKIARAAKARRARAKSSKPTTTIPTNNPGTRKF